MKKTPLKRKTPLKPSRILQDQSKPKSGTLTRTKLNKCSVRQSKRLEEYYAAKEEYMKDKVCCEICGNRRELDLHHKAGRIGKLISDKEHFIAICRECHNYIHSHPSEARRNGWLTSG
jgi:hypothetical protein